LRQTDQSTPCCAGWSCPRWDLGATFQSSEPRDCVRTYPTSRWYWRMARRIYAWQHPILLSAMGCWRVRHI